MTWAYNYGPTLRVWRGSRVDDGYSHGGQEPDAEVSWDTPTRIGPDQPHRPVALESAVEEPKTGAPLVLVEKLTAYMWYGTDVTQLDRVEIIGGPYAGMYEVDGLPAHWESPYTGEQPGTVVHLGRQIGGS